METLPFISVNKAWIAQMQGTVEFPLPFGWYVALDGSTWCRQEWVYQYRASFDASGLEYTVIDKPLNDFNQPLTIQF